MSLFIGPMFERTGKGEMGTIFDRRQRKKNEPAFGFIERRQRNEKMSLFMGSLTGDREKKI